MIWPAACREVPEQQALAEAMLEMATDLLWGWTGRRFGVCSVTAELVRDLEACGCAPVSTYAGRGLGLAGSTSAPWTPVLAGGVMVNLSCGCYPCGGARAGVVLPGPVVSVTRVLLDGVELPDSEWELRAGGVLVRRGGEADWPRAGLVVEYRRGVEVPVGGRIAAGVLAWELAKAIECPDDCALPQRITAITRQGVSVAVMDQFSDIDDGRTGIWLIDSWVSSVRREAGGGLVLSPDVWCPSLGSGWKVVSS